MCGICGAVAVAGPLDPSIRAAMPAMTEALRHRGPDDVGLADGDRGTLGHTRLAIIDRSGGMQPMANEDGSLLVVFNGEIYNHRALHAELRARGHRFRTWSDTEVIVHGFEEWGSACVERLEGMFAFAVLHRTRGELFLARDRLGKKPLFWAMLGGALHFASEIKALRVSPAWDGAVDPDAIEEYLALGYVVAPRSIYRHVRKLPSASWLRLRDGQITIRPYWDVAEFDEDHRLEPEVLADLETRLESAVVTRLESEVPLGAFLSGGIDSGLVVSFACQHLAEAPLTVSVGFRDAAHNELDAADRVARRWSTRHRSLLLEPRLEDDLDRIVDALDEPFADSSAVPTFWVCGAAREHVTVCLSGDGGDEVFGGYDFRYVPHALEDRLRRHIPRRPGRSLLRYLGRRWPRSRRLPRPLRLGPTLENLARDPAAAYFADLCFLKPRDLRRLLGRDPGADENGGAVFAAVTDVYRRCPSSSVLQRAQYADLKLYLPNDVLVKVDRLSMAHGLEVRCPLLDRRLVEFAFRVPTPTKLPRLRPKHLLRRLAERRLPPENLELPKRGFTAPVSRWIAGPLIDRFTAEVFATQAAIGSWLDVGVLREWQDEHRTGQADRSFPLWAAWMLERWARRERDHGRNSFHAPSSYSAGDCGAPRTDA